MAWNAQLHPKAPVGQANGGQFVAGSGGSSSSPGKSAPAKNAKPAAAPNGLGYSTAQWAQLQQLEAMAKAGKKLDAHQQHELHVAHQKRLAAHGIKPPKPKAAAKPKAKAKTTAKPKAAAKKPAVKAAPKPTTAAQKAANAAAFHL